MKIKFYVLKNGCILRSYLRKSLALSFYDDLFHSSDLDYDVIEMNKGNFCNCLI